MTSAKELLNHPFKGKIHPSELEEIEALLILTSLSSIGNIKIRQLIDYFGSAVNILCASKKMLLENSNIDSKALESLIQWKNSIKWQKSSTCRKARS